MHTLFSTSKNTLHAFFSSLSPDDIRDCCSPPVYKRGEDYFESDCVSQATYNEGKTLLKAVVNGNDDYTVTIMLSGGKVSGLCTCPYDGVCKHMVATMLYVINDESEIELESSDDKDTKSQFHQYLQTLSKDELVALVEKFATAQFRTEVKNKFTNTSTAYETFRKVERKITQLFKNAYLMHNPGNFSDALDNELVKLSGLEKPLQKEIEELLFHIMEEIESAFDNGYLYEDYNDYNYEASTVFKNFVTGYVSSLSNDEKTAFLANLDVALNEQSYDTFGVLRDVANSAFSDDDLPHLKKVLMGDYQDISQELAGKYYDRVSGSLSYDEKAAVLSVLMGHSSKRTIELATLYDAHGNLPKAIDTLKTWLVANQGSYYHNEDVYSLYLDLLKKGNYDLFEAAAEAIVNSPTNTMLSKAISVTGGGSIRYEQLLEQKNAGEMLRYLEKTNRLSEALALIKRKNNIYEDQVYEFFRTHKLVFPGDASEYFCKVIDKNLQGTGDRYYEAIADAIRQLMKADLAKANEYLNSIRTNYQRRRNLIAILRNL